MLVIFLQVLCFIIMICAAVTLSAIEDVEDQASVRYQDTDKYESAAGWLVFVSVMGMIYEPLVILLRFLNLEIFNQKFIYFMIAGCIVSSINIWGLMFPIIITYYCIIWVPIRVCMQCKIQVFCIEKGKLTSCNEV